MTIWTAAMMPGSSPLARGLLAEVGDDRPVPRIIPARAGFTVGEQARGQVLADHPRSRGVYPRVRGHGRRTGGSSPLARGLLAVTVGTATIAGSSPLARGLRCRPDRERGADRIIPARAGFTAIWGTTCARVTDHPRSRGVYPGRLAPRCFETGSSPLARGLQRERKHHAGLRRIIPARAGFTRGSSTP